MEAPDDRRYLESHEWHKVEGDDVRVGLSQFAVDELTDITYVDLPDADAPVIRGEPFGEIESVKATSDLYCGIDGRLVEINAAVVKSPGLINESPYDQGWLIKVRPADAAQMVELMSAGEYEKSVTSKG